MLARNIVWDTDGEFAELPTEVEIDPIIHEEDVADHLSDEYGFCIISLAIDRGSKDIDLGAFSVEVILQENGKYDVWIAHEGSSGSHYKDVTADQIGEHLVGDIEAFAEGYQQEFCS